MKPWVGKVSIKSHFTSFGWVLSAHSVPGDTARAESTGTHVCVSKACLSSSRWKPNSKCVISNRIYCFILMTIPGMDFRCLSVSTLVVSSLWCQLYSLNGYWSVVALRGPVLAASQASVQQKKTIAFWSDVRRPHSVGSGRITFT